jgi:two-component system cell cycle sensor histidine kinase/response regulator CckA
METYLRKLGYDVSATDRVSGALSILSGEPGIRLIITDIILGGRRTGIELAREALKINPDVAVLLVSGYADPTLTEQMADLARVGWLAKPFGQNTLAQRVRELLNQ